MQPYLTPTMLSLLTILVVFFIVLAVLWTVLPFAIFGIKKRLDAIHNELVRIREEFAIGRKKMEVQKAPEVEKR